MIGSDLHACPNMSGTVAGVDSDTNIRLDRFEHGDAGERPVQRLKPFTKPQHAHSVENRPVRPHTGTSSAAMRCYIEPVAVPAILRLRKLSAMHP